MTAGKGVCLPGRFSFAAAELPVCLVAKRLLPASVLPIAPSQDLQSCLHRRLGMSAWKRLMLLAVLTCGALWLASSDQTAEAGVGLVSADRPSSTTAGIRPIIPRTTRTTLAITQGTRCTTPGTPPTTTAQATRCTTGRTIRPTACTTAAITAGKPAVYQRWLVGLSTSPTQ